MNNEKHTPHRWIVVEILDRGEATQKVLAGWHGGYLDSDMWRLSSGITKIETFPDRYEFHNHSGSVYICRKMDYGVTSYSGMVLENFMKSLRELGASMTVVQGYDVAEWPWSAEKLNAVPLPTVATPTPALG